MPTIKNAPTALEQELYEMLNRFRANPEGEYDRLISDPADGVAAQKNITDAMRYFGVNVFSLKTQLDQLKAAAPLAWNDALARSSDRYSALMIEKDNQSHYLYGNSLRERFEDAGYQNWQTISENLFAFGEDMLYTHAGFVIDWGYDAEDSVGGVLKPNWQKLGDGIQDPAGHRDAMLLAEVTEVGIGIIEERNAATKVGPYVVTQHFGNRSDYKPQLLGVVLRDKDGDRFYDAGEGLGGITVTATGNAGTFTTTTWKAGGYQMELPKGSYTVTFSGASLDGTITARAKIGSVNVKLDAFARDAVSSTLVEGTAGPDTLVGAVALAQTLRGLDGNDTLVGVGGDDTLEGGAGNDRLIAERPAEESAKAAAIYRLYQATLDRAPDRDGHASWTKRFEDGDITLEGAANGFIKSPEFKATYGNATNEEFVNLLYRNVLDRSADAKGLARWTGDLENGKSRAEVVLGFSQSPEFAQKMSLPAMAFGVEGMRMSWTDDVYRLYGATLGREPDQTGLGNWTKQIAEGMSFSKMVEGFTGSAEFKARYGDKLSDGAFVTLLYKNVLNRDPDQTGYQAWTTALGDGSKSRPEVVEAFAQSTENRKVTADAFVNYMRGQSGNTLNGGPGDDLLFGGFGADTFQFKAADKGSDTLIGLEVWDTLAFSGFGYTDRKDVMDHLSEENGNVIFSDGGVEITFLDTKLASFDDVTLSFA